MASRGLLCLLPVAAAGRTDSQPAARHVLCQTDSERGRGETVAGPQQRCVADLGWSASLQLLPPMIKVLPNYNMGFVRAFDLLKHGAEAHERGAGDAAAAQECAVAEAERERD